MKYLLIGAAIVAVIAGGWYLFKSPADQSTEQTAPIAEAPSTEPTETTDSQTPSPQPGAYVDYSSSVIASTAGTKILFFHAPWCPQCRALESSIKAGTIPNDVTIIKVDYDTNQSLRQKYGVTIQTTLVKVDDNGNLVEKYVAYDSPTLAAVSENLL